MADVSLFSNSHLCVLADVRLLVWRINKVILVHSNVGLTVTVFLFLSVIVTFYSLKSMQRCRNT